MSRPLIGIIPQIDKDERFTYFRLFPEYQQAVEKAGGIGLMVPITDNRSVLEELVNSLDGFLFTGGNDIDPILYGEEKERESNYSSERDQFESLIFPIVKESGKPILAICRGLQIIDVLNGGSLFQDLDKQNFINHTAYEPSMMHEVHLEENSLIKKIFGKDKILTNSFHHQGIKELGEGLTPTGKSKDGLVEAFEIDGLDFGVAVQWHPEVMFTLDQNNGELFKAFIEACEDKKNQH